ncbi:MAG: sodium:solute symporter, partial [Rhodospirillales bacterium]
MLAGWFILVASLGYLSLLFAIAYYGDKRADQGRSLIANPYIYALSIAVYCTSWTFYGSVGRAASSGVGFLPIYLGPTLMFALGWFVLRKIIRITKVHHITSIADFISSRYGKSHLLGGLVTVIAVVGIMPYISLQLKAVSISFNVLLQYPEVITPANIGSVPVLGDTALYVALIMAAFSILFGTRHIDATEHHEGMVAAIAFESVIKLIAFLAVGIFVTFGIFEGFGDLFGKAAEDPELRRLMTMEKAGTNWVTLTFLSMAAIICLPRQFQMTVVENTDESHIDKAMWLFPLYLFAINLFVLPIAFGGLLHFPGGGVDADTFMLALPMSEKQQWLALLVFIGGLSAATGMVIVAAVTLSTMICNDLVMPVLLRFAWLRLTERRDLSGLLLGIRRGAIILILLLGYLYFRLIGESYTLVTIGLVSFAAAAQFAPAIFGGIFWKGGSQKGAVAGLTAGFLIWTYTLLLPSFARSGWLPEAFIEHGAYGAELLRPYALFGLEGMDHISHSLFWSMLANIGAYVWVSLLGRQ